MFGPYRASRLMPTETDQKVPETGYWSTISVRVVDERTVEIISKKNGKTMFTEVDHSVP